MKISEYPSSTELLGADSFIFDGANGTKRIEASELYYALIDDNPVAHRTNYRGKNLGTSITASQKTEINNGTFHDLFVGDYWILNDRTYRIVDIDIFMGNASDEGNPVNTHHLVMMPDEAMGVGKMNTDQTTQGGYPGSEMYSSGLSASKQEINKAFPNMLITVPLYYGVDYKINPEGDGQGGGWAMENAAFDIDVALPSVNMIVDHTNFIRSAYNSNILRTGIEASCYQFYAFKANPSLRFSSNSDFWCTDVVNGYSFCRFNWTGNIGAQYANTDHDIRPWFVITGSN